jgi:hypothetical protein
MKISVDLDLESKNKSDIYKNIKAMQHAIDNASPVYLSCLVDNKKMIEKIMSQYIKALP